MGALFRSLAIVGGLMTVVAAGFAQAQTPPRPGSAAVAIFRPSANVLTLSKMPFPLVSSRMVIRSRPRTWLGGGSGTLSNWARMYWS